MSSYFTEPSDVDRHAAPETVQTYMINLESELAAERDAVAELQTQAAEDADTIVGLTRKYTAAMFMVERLIDEKGNATAHNSKLLAENKLLKKKIWALERWQDSVRHYSRQAAMYADERMPASYFAEGGW